MIDQMVENFRRVSESSMQMQQDLFRQWTQQWSSAIPSVPGATADWGDDFRRRSIDMTLEGLNRHRESLEASYRAGIELLAKAFRISEAKSPEDYRRNLADLWRKMFTTIKEQSEAQLAEYQRWGEKLFEMTPRATNGQS
jgi:hypothetical protein